MKLSLPAIALQRPVAVAMISISMLAMGVIAWMRMPLEFLPDIEEPYIGVSIPYPGATPEQAEQQIAIPVEGEFRTISGLNRIRTISQRDGCYVGMMFDIDTDMTMASAEVRDRMERLKLVLPAEVERLYLQRFSSSAFPVMAVGVFRDHDQEEFVHLVRTVIEPRLRRVEGVANIDILTPIQEKNILVEFDQSALRGMGLGLAEVVAALRESSINETVGELVDGGAKYFVRTVGEYRRIEDVADLIVGPNGLRLKEIATVRYSGRDDLAFIALDGMAGAFLFIVKESEANTVATCNAVHEEFEKILAEPVFDDVRLRQFFSQGYVIEHSLDSLLRAGLFGAGMALIVLFVFLHRFRPTIIVALTIPCSLVFSVVFMFFAGMTLNLITMVSMIIVVGMLVDNSIVVVENIIRYRQTGLDRFESARRGASEVGLAILAATATTWVVFVPIFYMDAGQMSVLMAQLGLPLIVALCGSLVISLSVIPLAMSRMKDPKHDNFFHMLGNKFRRGQEATGGGVFSKIGRIQPVQRFVSLYGVILDLALRWRLATLALLVGMLYLTYAVPMQRVGSRDLSELDMREMRINLRLDQNYDFQMAGNLVNKLEDAVNEVRDELGVRDVMKFYSGQQAWLHIYLVTTDDGPIGQNPPYTTSEVLKYLREYLPREVPGARIRFDRGDTSSSGTQGTASVRMRGDDTRLLTSYADRFRDIMGGIENMTDSDTSLEDNTQEVQLHIDETLAAQAGVTPTAIAQTVYMALGGTRLPYMKEGTREVPVWAQFREEDRKSKSNLDNVTVMGSTGRLLPLSDLVEYRKAFSPEAIHRVDGKNEIVISAKADQKHIQQIYTDLRDAADDFAMPVGYSLSLGDELVQMSEDVVNFNATLLMAVLLIFIVMSALFESFLLPISILSSVPLALSGAVWMLFITDSQLDTVTFIGCVLMAGLIVNNGIVIVDHINSLRRQRGTFGRTDSDTLRHAITDAGKDRFRPVMMTAITTILGVVPLAMATSGGAATFSGLGRALIGGLTAGTVLTLFIVPLFYSLIEDFQNWFKDFFGGLVRLSGKKRKGSAAAE